jgi:S1-C subfamily serine protease
MREQQARVGVSAATPPQIYNIATGLVVDEQGHIITRLTNIDPEDKNQKITVTTADGRSLPAEFIGLDCATGFAVLRVESLKVALPTVLTASELTNGSAVSIWSADISRRVISTGGDERVGFYPSVTQAQGRVKTDSIYSPSHGALTLLSNSLLSRNDSSIVTTAQNQVIGIAKWMGFGRAYLYPLEFLRDTAAKRVIEKNGSVAAGWLGLVGHSLGQISDSEFAALGLQQKAGVLVRELAPDSPAAAAGIQLNDVIVSLDGIDVKGEADLKALLMSSPAGRNINIKAIRNQTSLEVKVALGARPYTPMEQSLLMLEEREPGPMQVAQIQARLAELLAQRKALLAQAASKQRNEAVREIDLEARPLVDKLNTLTTGVQDRKPVDSPIPANVSSTGFNFAAGFIGLSLTPQLAKEKFNVAAGMLVAAVRPGTSAERAGLKVGDVIIGAAQTEPINGNDLSALLSNQQTSVFLKIVRRNQETQANETIVITLSNQ